MVSITTLTACLAYMCKSPLVTTRFDLPKQKKFKRTGDPPAPSSSENDFLQKTIPLERFLVPNSTKHK